MGCSQKFAGRMVVLIFLVVLACQGDYLGGGGGGGRVRPERMGPDECSEEDVVVYQSSANPLPSGIPAYTVHIINVCGGCRVSDVHVSCGDFASTELVDPAKFQRVGFNDCVVKGGAAMEPTEAVSFQYSNSFAYPLTVASVACD
ncbi:hypothetical protein ACP70R_019042 [Stipagrostis hirtigluma subsp. patula]